jgi:DNA repair protein RecN (Recombination protein N)
MRIRGLGVIDDAVLELSPGFTVVTGETGAGKTMVVTGLGLLFGERAESALVRAGGPTASVEGRLALDPAGPATARALDAGAEVEEGVLLVGRTVAAEGRSRAVLGGRTVPIGVLGELAEELIAVHGQNEQDRLLRPVRQRDALDRYAGEPVTAPLGDYRQTYQRLRAVESTLAELTTRASERAQEADLLRFGLGEIGAAEPQQGEDAELSTESERLEHADALRTAAAGAHAALLGDASASTSSVDEPDAVGLVGLARRTLEQVREHDPDLAALSDRLAEVSYLLSDVATELAGYAESVDADPVRLAAVHERRAVLAGLTRKYGDTIDEVLNWAERSTARLAELEGDDERIDELTAERKALTDQLAGLATTISAGRQDAAERFGAAVTAELTALAMPHAQLTVAVRQAESPDGLDVAGRRLAYGPAGVDEVELLLTAHPGAPPRAIQRGASGGERSRIMLAVEVVFAGADPVPTFVFDEIDAGIGGSAAVEVGRRLAKLARTAQVIVVTHLPQVAAFADRHLLVEKSGDGLVTRSGVTTLDDPGRVRELSRMLAGLTDSETAAAHAEELLATAADAKSRD